MALTKRMLVPGATVAVLWLAPAASAPRRPSPTPCHDRASTARLIDLVDPAPQNCERVGRANRLERPNVQIRSSRPSGAGGAVQARLACPSAARRTCRGSLRSAALPRRGRAVGSGRATSFRMRPGRSRTTTTLTVQQGG